MTKKVIARFINSDDDEFDFEYKEVILLSKDVLFEFTDDDWVFRFVEEETDLENLVIDLNDRSVDFSFLGLNPRVNTKIDFDLLATESFLNIVRLLLKQ